MPVWKELHFMELPVGLVKPPPHLRGLSPVQAYDHYALPQIYAHYLCDRESTHRFQGRGRSREKTILTLCLNAGTYQPRVQGKLDAFAVAAQNGPLSYMQSKSKELLLGLKVLLKEYCPAAFRIGVLVRDCNWARRDPGSGKNALAVLESCLLVMVSLVGDQWENVEYIKTLVLALVTWQRWHSRTARCIHSEEYGEAMLSTLCAQCRIWTTITSLSGTTEIFVTLSQTLTRVEEPAVLTDEEVCDAV